ncbi:glycosyltransferase [Roseomonas sp. CAU 1739]|uniref:glycosyltransferase n=1 Tax=Roseomonas sp. CAU 1739 TaxID=3140364 RepID=UPI00325B5252
MTQAPSGRPRRVLHLLKRYRPDFTGEGVFLERCSAVMQELAPNVQHDLLVTHTPSPARPSDGAACSALSQVIYLTRRPVGEARRHILLVWWLLRNLRHYDTVHARTHVDWYFIGYLMARMMGRRLVLSATLDDSLPVLIGWYRQQLRPLAARAFRLFHAYVGISPKLHAENRAAAVDPARCHLIPCGITVPPSPSGQREAMRARIGAGPKDPVLLFVGGLCERKDPLTLIEALPALRAVHPNLRLVLVGPPLERDYVERMRARIDADGTQDAASFVGEQLDPHPWFEAADMLVFGSRLEGFGTVVPEAMAHGLPVVVRDLPGVNDSFAIEGETAFRFTDPDGYIAAVLRLAGDAALRRRMGEAGRALARRDFSMRSVAARYLDVYGLAAEMSGPQDAEPESGLGCTASILDPRFHEWVPVPDGPPLLITIIDAEEAFDWSKPLTRNASDVSSMASQHLAHRIFDRHGVVPTYMVDYPVVDQEAGRAPLRELLQDGRCEIGAQLHPWVTPPFLDEVNDRNSYAGNLPIGLEFAKARQLTERLGETFGVAPRIYRTGRFGVGLRTADILKRLGYLADSSLDPYWPPAGAPHGPDIWALSSRPFWVDRERSLIEIPTSAALVGRLNRHGGSRLAPLVFNRAAEVSGVTGLMARLDLMERIRLSPEGISIDEAKRLTRGMIASGHRVFVLTYHTPSLVPGNTPYVRTAEDLHRFLQWLDAYYAFFREEIGGRCGSWREARPGTPMSHHPVPAAAAR